MLRNVVVKKNEHLGAMMQASVWPKVADKP